MTAFKEFQGKTLDQAIEEACTYYGVPREKLEIEIVNDAKTGIFGLVGAKKATIMAARAAVSSRLLDEEQKTTPDAKAAFTDPKGKSGKAEQKNAKGKNTELKNHDAPAQEKGMVSEQKNSQPRHAENKSAASKNLPAKKAKAELAKRNEEDVPTEQSAPMKAAQAGKNSTKNAAKTSGAHKNNVAPKRTSENKGKKPADVPLTDRGATDLLLHDEAEDEKLAFALDLHAPEKVCEEVCTVINRFITPIVGNIPCAATAVHGRVRVEVDCGEAAGILVGRDGQTLAAIQYLTARIAGKKLGGAVRLQIDVGNYRERQEERLRELALALADKVKSSKRSQSTRPLTAYQRRIIHLTLENDELLHTHSKGEGAQKRVIIQLRKPGKVSTKEATPATYLEFAHEQEVDCMDDSQFFPEDSSKA